MVTLFGQSFTRSELMKRIGHIRQIAGITHSERTDGLERGNRTLDVRTGSGLEFTVMPERGLDISHMQFQGIPYSWKSPSGDVSPAYFESDGMGWLRTFPGGLFSTCGLTHFGSPCEDEGESLGIHGRISHIPAHEVNTETRWEGDQLLFRISGKIRQSRMFGENLLLERIITAKLGKSEIEIDDTVTNEGFEACPHMILYHFNLGFPLISEHSKLAIPAETTEARDEAALQGVDSWGRFTAPQQGFQEQVFHHTVRSQGEGEDGITTVEISNPMLAIGLRIMYRKSQLPNLFQWKIMGEGTYVLGIEPANSRAIQGRKTAREQGDLTMLQPGEFRRYQIKIVAGAL